MMQEIIKNRELGEEYEVGTRKLLKESDLNELWKKIEEYDQKVQETFG